MLSPSKKGKISENLVSNDLMRKGFSVFETTDNSNAVDLVAVSPDINNHTLRFQVKTAYLEANGSIRCRTQSRAHSGKHHLQYTKKDFDYFAFVLPDEDKIFYVPTKWVDLSKNSFTKKQNALPKRLQPEHRI